MIRPDELHLIAISNIQISVRLLCASDVYKIHTQVLKSPGATIKLSKTACIFVTKLAIAVCSNADGLKS